MLWRSVANPISAETGSREILKVPPQDFEVFQSCSAAESRELKREPLGGPREVLEILTQHPEAFQSCNATESLASVPIRERNSH